MNRLLKALAMDCCVVGKAPSETISGAFPQKDIEVKQ
jgi:hypothetical protein